MTPLFSISDGPIKPAELSALMESHAAGAFVAFEGRVRDHNDGKEVLGLSYDVFQTLAESEGEAILKDAIGKFGLVRALAVHRRGDLILGECAVWVGVMAPHRGEAYAASRYIIDAIKHRLPIWKQERYADGSREWVNCQHHDSAQPSNMDHKSPDLTHYYARQIRLPEVGTVGQQKLSEAKVLVVGVGGLGSAAALSLASAGIGKLGLVEADRLEASNLHRQMIYPANSVGERKVKVAAEQLRAHNPMIEIVEYDARLTAENAESLLQDYDLVLDCTDNFQTKYLLNDAAVLYGKPLIQASIYRFDGQLLVIDPKGGRQMHNGCLRCLFPEAPEPGSVGDCANAGVLGTVPAIFGALQANEAIKYILGLPTAVDHLVLFDLLSLQSRKLARTRNSSCPVCGDEPSIKHLSPEKTVELEIALTHDDDLSGIASTYHLIDLRELHEGGAIDKTLRLPFSRFDPVNIPFEKDAPILLFCAQGQRSLNAAKAMRAAGWLSAFSLHGGVTSLPLHNKAA